MAKFWLAAFLATGAACIGLFHNSLHTFSFEPGKQVQLNPLMGYAPSADNPLKAENFQLVYVDVTFRELEPEKGKYQFRQIEESNYLDRWQEEGKRVVFRFVCDRPGKEAHMDIPDWLHEETGDGVFYDGSYGKGYSPDYENPVFIEAHRRAIMALGSHFGSDDFFFYVELGSLGHWGEWHVNEKYGVPPIPFYEIRMRYLEPYFEAFPNSYLMMRRPFREAAEHGLGIFNDMIGEPVSTAEWLGWIADGGIYNETGETDGLIAMADSWKTAPNGGEFTSSLPMDTMLEQQLPQTLAGIRASHLTFIGPKIPETETPTADGSGAVLRELGYRLRVARGRLFKNPVNGAVKVTMDWTNDGNAPIYADWPVFLYLLDENGTVLEKQPLSLALSHLLPETTVSVTQSFEYHVGHGESYAVGVAVCDPNTGVPAVKLAAEGNVIDGVFMLVPLQD